MRLAIGGIESWLAGGILRGFSAESKRSSSAGFAPQTAPELSPMTRGA
jgi:hypothetical protein